jgi:acyl transferase domain-containing protein
VLAVIRGTAVNQDGRTSALTVPNGPAQQAVIRAALADARIEPSRVSYVEAHGTGTSLGDPIEATALGAVFGSRTEPLLIGSVKANIGHAEAAAGVAGLIKVVLAMQHREIPPQLHFAHPNPRIDWASLPLRVPTAPTPWGRPDEPLYAGVSAFGFGGTNAHVVVEAPVPTPERVDAAPALPGLLVLSAKTATALPALAALYRTALSGTALSGTALSGTALNDSAAGDAALGNAALGSAVPHLADVCASAAHGRAHLSVRAAVSADTLTGTLDALDALAEGRAKPGLWRGEITPATDSGVAFIYPGQGALRWGTGRELYARVPAYRAAIDRCAAALRAEWGVPLTEVLYGAAGVALIERTEYAQAALFATEYAMTEAWASLGIRPSAVVGHSVGEFAAACAAGVLGVEDACRLLAERGRLMEPLGGRMAVVAAGEARVRELASGCPGVTIAALNGRRQTVISGERAQVDRVIAAATDAGLASKALGGDVAFHSALMDPMLPAWRAFLAREAFAAPQCEWVSTLTAREIATLPDDYWVTQVRQPVQFAAAAERLWALGYRVMVEVGPSAALATLASESAGTAPGTGVWVAGLRHGRPEFDTWREGVAQLYVAGARIDWTGWCGPRSQPVPLPTYPFERTRYWVEAPVTDRHDTAADNRGAAAAARQDYTVRWEAVADDAQVHQPVANGVWIVCGGRTGTMDAVAAELRRHGASVLTTPEDGSVAVTARRAGATPVAGLVHVGALDLPPASDGTAAATLERDALAGSMAVVNTLREVAAEMPSARVWVLTRGAVAARAGEPVAVSQAPVWGLARVAALEHPDTWGGVVDLDPREPGVAGLEHLLHARGEDQLALRDGRLYVPRLQPSTATSRPSVVRAGATYLVTGGLGALGLDVAERLIDLGATHILLAGRRDPSDGARERIAGFLARGVEVRTERADVSSADDMTRLFDRAAVGMPSIRGIVHAAGANGSHALADLDAATLKAVAEAKVSGAWLLHELTRTLPLDFFVTFSSIASVWGSKGQAHYAAANAFLDALVAQRVAQGLPALSINWGAWASGGMATADAQRWLHKVGINALTREQALAAFEAWLPSSGQAIVADVDWPRFLEVYQARRAHAFFTGMAAEGASTARVAPRGVDRLAALRAMDPADARDAVTQLVRAHVMHVLNLEPGSAPAPHQGFFSIGFDSLMALELKNRLTADLQVPLSSTLAFDYPNIRDLSHYLATDVVRVGAATEYAADGAVDRDGLGTAPTDVATAETPTIDVDASIAATLARLERLTGKR